MGRAPDRDRERHAAGRELLDDGAVREGGEPVAAVLLGDDHPEEAVLAKERPDLFREIAAVREGWMAEWLPKLTSDETPLTPYRVLWDLHNTVDRANTIITHDSGSPRDQLLPFWEPVKPYLRVTRQPNR